MKKRRLYKAWRPLGPGALVIFFCLWGFHVEAQTGFTYKAALDTITRDAFYEIDLPPALVAKCRGDLGDLRILGPGKRFVAYVLKDPSTTSEGEKKYAVISDAVMQKDSSNRHSYLTVDYREAYQIDWVAFAIRSPIYYRRSLRIAAAGADTDEWTIVADIVLEPNHHFFKIPNVKTRRLRFDITNEDNAPLVVSELACYQSERSLLTYLQAGYGYEVLAGNTRAKAPVYDLKYFTDSVHGSIQVLQPGEIHVLNSFEQAATFDMHDMQPVATDTVSERSSKTRGSNLPLWGSLLVVLLALIYFSIRMVKAIGKKDTHDRL
jgi:hypothetical protein